MQYLSLATALCLLSLSANAALFSRAGGQAYYDDVLNITWVANANLARTSGYDADGQMTWDEALGWIAALNAQNTGLGYLGKTGWRLPSVTDSGAPGCDYTFSGGECGFNLDPASSEMARMFYSTLGNIAAFDTSNVARPCADAPPAYCLANDGPFSNLQPDQYWSGTAYAAVTGGAWYFDFSWGEQDWSSKIVGFYAWAVHPGDIGVVPFSDGDSDGVADAIDNCTGVSNPTQLDADGDGYGNICDGDLNNTNLTTAQDNVVLRNQLNQPASASPTAAAADLNGSGLVTAQDNVILRNQLNTVPGPSGHGCGQPAGSVACP